MRRYLEQRHPDFFVFYAEQVWDQVVHVPGLNALAMEDQLARLADIVIIVVESPGTFTELGAFSLNEELRRKMFPILDEQYEEDDSFINTGPIRWIDAESSFRPALYTDFAVVLRAGVEIDTRLTTVREGLDNPEADEITSFADRPKHLLFFLCDLMAVIGPSPASHASYYVERVFGGTHGAWSIESMLGLAESLGVLKSVIHGGFEERLYYRPLDDGSLKSFQHPTRMFVLPEERARFIEVYQRIPVIQDVLLDGCLEG